MDKPSEEMIEAYKLAQIYQEKYLMILANALRDERAGRLKAEHVLDQHGGDESDCEEPRSFEYYQSLAHRQLMGEE